MRKPMLSGALALLAILAGCVSTVDDPRSKPPLVVLVSQKPLDYVSACLAQTWSAQSYHLVHFDAVVQPRVGGGQIVKSIGMDEAADLVADDAGTKVLYFSRYNTPTDSWPAMRIQGIRQCL